MAPPRLLITPTTASSSLPSSSPPASRGRHPILTSQAHDRRYGATRWQGGPFRPALLLALVLLGLSLLPHHARAFMPNGAAAAGPSREAKTTASTTRCWSSMDPGGMFLHPKANPLKRNVTQPPSKGAGQRSDLPRLTETMALIFSKNKREVDENRKKFRELVVSLQTAEDTEQILPMVASNIRFLLSANISIFMQEMMEEIDKLPPGSVVDVAGNQVSVEDQRLSLTNIFTLFMDFVDRFVDRVQEEQRSHQQVLRQIVEVAKNGSNEALDEKMKELRPCFREDFLSFLQGEIKRISEPPVSEETQKLISFLNIVQGRVLAEVELLVGTDTALVSRLLAYEDELSMSSSLRASLLAGTITPTAFLGLVDQALAELEERLPPLLEVNPHNQELLTIQQRLRVMQRLTTDFMN